MRLVEKEISRIQRKGLESKGTYPRLEEKIRNEGLECKENGVQEGRNIMKEDGIQLQQRIAQCKIARGKLGKRDLHGSGGVW